MDRRVAIIIAGTLGNAGEVTACIGSTVVIHGRIAAKHAVAVVAGEL